MYGGFQNSKRIKRTFFKTVTIETKTLDEILHGINCCANTGMVCAAFALVEIKEPDIVAKFLIDKGYKVEQKHNTLVINW